MKLRLPFPILIVLVIFSARNVYGQQSPRHSLSLAPVLGTHLVSENPRFFNDRIWGADIVYGFDLSGREDDWMHILRAREAGLSFIYRNFDRLDGYLDTSAHSFGQSFGLAAQLEIALLETRSFRISLIPAVGISYISKNFFTDPDNRFIGSHLNQTLKAALQVEVPVSEQLSIIANAHVLHLSNGGFNIPNSGLNTGNVSLGLKSRFGTQPYRRLRDSFEPLGGNSFELAAGLGRRGVYESHKGILRSGLYAGYNYRLNQVLDLKGGLDGVYYFTVYDPDNRVATYQHYGSSLDRWSLGLSLGAEVNMGRLSLNGRYGRYLHYNDLHGIRFYWKSGLKYFLTPHLGIQTTLHMHRFQADFVDLGLALRW